MKFAREMAWDVVKKSFWLAMQKLTPLSASRTWSLIYRRNAELLHLPNSMMVGALTLARKSAMAVDDLSEWVLTSLELIPSFSLPIEETVARNKEVTSLSVSSKAFPLCWTRFIGELSDEPLYDRIRLMIVAQHLTGHRLRPVRCCVIVCILVPFFWNSNVIDTWEAFSRFSECFSVRRFL